MTADNRKSFGGRAVVIDRADINTDEIIPAKYLTEISKTALKSHLLEDLALPGFDSSSEDMQCANVLITRSNFGCGSSREHAVWALEVNDINVVIAESFARIFRQNCFNCGVLAIELEKGALNKICMLHKNLQVCKKGGFLLIEVDVHSEIVYVRTSITKTSVPHEFKFKLNPFDKELVLAGGWLKYADEKY